ncbi:MAG: UDP-N-acetylmuramoyl-L-alanine--D-glutamate ligase, partial [Desulfobacterales bacterium]|nr:UDP-N-acetylmuramoyl-L-alanine--D-glutamate ligase [Desulfobacterales bacterium]
KGLGEFAYRNNIDLRGRVHFPYSRGRAIAPSDLALPSRVVVPVGGGKDSIVTIEALKAAGEPLQLFSLGEFETTAHIASAAGAPCIVVDRSISRSLLEINSRGALNGHVPFSAILAFILPVAAILYGFDAAALSNERSANTGNLVEDGEEVNHQYSKSLEFERNASEFIGNNVLSNFRYFSFLRPLSDIGVARLFSELTAYHAIFMSCNSAYKLRKEKRNKGWCLSCPKCRFTFLALAPFIEKRRMISIFGANPLDDEEQIRGFDELLGVRGHKPFECVGEYDESMAAFILLNGNPAWNKDRLVRRFEKKILPRIDQPDEILRSVFRLSAAHALPPSRYKALIRFQEFHHKKIAVWGLGREGKAMIEALQKMAPRSPVTVIDDSPLSPEASRFLEARKGAIPVKTGKEAISSLHEFDLVIKSPGVSIYRPEIKKAEERGTRFTSSTRIWFNERSHETIICVTGTKGKSTTAALIAHVLKRSGRDVALGGNIGAPIIEMIDSPAPDVWVVEMSSYQTSDFTGGPTVSVLLNLYPEHLDWHRGEENYYRDKLNLFMGPGEGKSVLNYADPRTLERTRNLKNRVYFNREDGIHLADGFICDGEKRLLDLNEVKLKGVHNASNICAALTAVRLIGAPVEECLEAAAEFKGLPHRLHLLGERNGIWFVDDSISTTPQSAIAAVKSWPGQPITLLLGGFDRGLDLSELTTFLGKEPVHAVITMPESGTRIAESLAESPSEMKAFEARDLKRAVEIAKKVTPAGGVVLLSPAAPSYNFFKNFEERGKAFAEFSGFS